MTGVDPQIALVPSTFSSSRNDVVSTDGSPTFAPAFAFVFVVAIAHSSAPRTDACSLGFILETSRNGWNDAPRSGRPPPPAPATSGLGACR